MARLVRLAKYNNPDTDIDKDWVLVRSTICELTGIPFDYSYRVGYRRPLAPSIDRIDSSRGYTKDNCRVILAWLNIAKADMSEKIFLDLLKEAVYNIDNKMKVKV